MGPVFYEVWMSVKSLVILFIIYMKNHAFRKFTSLLLDALLLSLINNKIIQTFACKQRFFSHNWENYSERVKSSPNVVQFHAPFKILIVKILEVPEFLPAYIVPKKHFCNILSHILCSSYYNSWSLSVLNL